MVSARGASAFTRVREKRQVGRACESQHGAFGWGVGVSLRTRPKPRLSARRAMPRPPAFGRTNPRMRIGPVWQNEPEGCALAPSGRTKRRMRVVWQNEPENARWHRLTERTRASWRQNWQNEPELDDRIGLPAACGYNIVSQARATPPDIPCSGPCYFPAFLCYLSARLHLVL